VAASRTSPQGRSSLLQSIAQRQASQAPQQQITAPAPSAAQQQASYGDMGGKGGGSYGGGGGVASSGSPTDSSSGSATPGSLAGYSNAYLAVDPNSSITTTTSPNPFGPFGTDAVPGTVTNDQGAQVAPGGLGWGGFMGGYTGVQGVNTSQGNPDQEGYAASPSGAFGTVSSPTTGEAGYGISGGDFGGGSAAGVSPSGGFGISASGGEGGGTSPGGGDGGGGGGGGGGK
jgi:hypothetical protein